MPISPTQRRLGRSSDPSSSLPYCPQIRPAATDIPVTLRYKFFESGLALLPQLPTCLHVHLFLLPSALPNPPKFLVLLEVKLLHAFESRALFKQRRKGESCSMIQYLIQRGNNMVKVVETGYPTGLLVEKGNNGKTQYKLDKEHIYYWLKKG